MTEGRLEMWSKTEELFMWTTGLVSIILLGLGFYISRYFSILALVMAYLSGGLTGVKYVVVEKMGLKRDED
jgi:hypothetical protein